MQIHKKILKKLTYLNAFLAFVLCCWLPGIAMAALPQTDPSRIVAVTNIAAEAKRMFFHMTYAVQPACQRERNDWAWSFGPWPRTIPVKPLNSPHYQAESEAIAAHFNLSPGSSIVLTQVDKTPWGYAGLKFGEVFEFSSKDGSLSRLLGLPRTDPASVEATDQAIRANLWADIDVIRNGQAVRLQVMRVPVCTADLVVVDSKYRYADSDDRDVIITVPLLQKLTRDELVVVLSHEVAHVALGLSKGRSRSKIIATALFGAIATIGENQQSGLTEPKAIDLINADRLAMRLSNGFGVDPESYSRIIHQLVADEDSFGAPTYRRTRGLGPDREAALQRNVDSWIQAKTMYRPAVLDTPTVMEISRRARLINTNPASIFEAAHKPSAASDARPSGNIAASQAATELSNPVPVVSVEATPSSPLLPPSGFAEVADVAAVPYISETGRDAYRKWLTIATPRAFAISPAGGSAAAFGLSSANELEPRDPSQRALARCNRISTVPCQLYAVDQRVVWIKP